MRRSICRLFLWAFDFTPARPHKVLVRLRSPMLSIIALVLHRGGASDRTKLIVVIVVSLVAWLVVAMDWDSLVARLQLLRLI